MPTPRDDVASEATPATKVTALPRLVAPSLNWTVPLGVPPVPLRVAVKFTLCP